MLELLILQERGNLSLLDSPDKYLPHFNLSRQITLEMLASQLSGLGAERPLNPLTSFPIQTPPAEPLGFCGQVGFGCPAQEFLNIIATEEPVFRPATQPSCMSSIWPTLTEDSYDAFTLLGQLIQSAYGISTVRTDFNFRWKFQL